MKCIAQNSLYLRFLTMGKSARNEKKAHPLTAFACSTFQRVQLQKSPLCDVQMALIASSPPCLMTEVAVGGWRESTKTMNHSRKLERR